MSSKAQTREKDYERGIRIADRRKAMGLSQDELAHRVGIGRQALSAIENGGDFKTQTLDNSIVGKIRRNGFSQRDVDRQWNQIVNMIRKKQISGVVVANMAAISSSVADAYFKVGLVIEAGGIVVTVDEGRLDMHIKKGA